MTQLHLRLLLPVALLLLQWPAVPVCAGLLQLSVPRADRNKINLQFSHVTLSSCICIKQTTRVRVLARAVCRGRPHGFRCMHGTESTERRKARSPRGYDDILQRISSDFSLLYTLTKGS